MITPVAYTRIINLIFGHSHRERDILGIKVSASEKPVKIGNLSFQVCNLTFFDEISMKSTHSFFEKIVRACDDSFEIIGICG